MQEECLRVGEKDLAREKHANRAIYEMEDGKALELCSINIFRPYLGDRHLASSIGLS
jgi:hypothetical protein